MAEMTLADFWRFYRAAVRRKWLMLAVIASTMVVVVAGCLVMPRYYKSTASVMPSDQALQRPMIAGSAPESSDRSSVFNAEARTERLANLIYLAHSEAVMARAAAAANIREAPQSLARRVTVEVALVPVEDQASRTAPRTGIIKITTLDKDAARSVRLTNAIAQAFADFYRELSHSDAVSNRKLLEGELASSKRDLDRAQTRLAQYRAASGGAGTDLTEAQPAISPAEHDRDATEAELRAVSAQLAASRARLRQEQPTIVAEEGSSENPAAAKLQTDLLDLEGKLAAELAIHTDRHPTVVALRAQIDDARRRLSTEMERVISHRTVSRNPLYGQLASQVATLESQEAALTARLGAMNQVAARERGQFAQASSRGVELAALTREYSIAEDTYRRLKAAVDQARIDENTSNDTGAIQIVDLARTALGPVTKGPSPVQLIGLGLILSMALAFALAIALDVLDDRINTTDDVMRTLQLPVTGIIPGMEGVRAKQLPLITQVLPSSPYAEAYRFLRTDLLFTCMDQPIQTLCVVTPKPGQGGTTTIANLAIALAEADKRVILVDADLRRPSLHHIFGLPNDVGLTTILSDGASLSDALQETHVSGLQLLTAGPEVRNPSNLISSNRMRSLMAEMRDHADFVLFDTPSAIAFSDAAIIASMTDGALMVVRARQPLRGSQLQVGALLNKARANIIGAVLNDVAPETVDTYYFHSHYYSPELAATEHVPSSLPARATPPSNQALDDGSRPAVEPGDDSPTAEDGSARVEIPT
jgi:succinoglycan biosynthesis transport protein ExoP